MTLNGQDILGMTVDARARAGLFLAIQYPVEMPGVSVANFLRTAKTALDGEAPKCAPGSRTSTPPWRGRSRPDVRPAQRQRGLLRWREEAPRDRPAELLKPKFAMLDETDCGLDIDALSIVTDGVNRYTSRPTRACC